MTDLDKLKELLDGWGVPHKLYGAGPEYICGQAIKVGGYTHQHDPRGTVTGYNGMYTLFEFDDDGKFISMGAWE